MSRRCAFAPADEASLGAADAVRLSRRALLKRATTAALLASAAGELLDACAVRGHYGDHTSAPGTKSAKNPLGVKDEELDVVIFDGGYTDRYAVQIHEPLYQKAFPKAVIKHESEQDMTKVLQPRFAAGDPPDVINNSGAGALDLGALVASNQLADLTELWEASSVDDPGKKVRETVVPGTMETGSFNGKPYVLYYVSTVFGLWYSDKLFRQKNWNVPTDWDSFITVLDQMKTAGLTAFAYAGKNAAYYMWNVILTHAAKIGGPHVLKDIDNLEDDAWTNDAVRQAAALWAEIGTTYMAKQYEGLIHTEVQLQHNQYKLGFYSSGSWLPNEQSKVAPADFEYRMIPIPVKPGGKMSPKAVRATAGEGFIVPRQAKNKDGGLEYLRQMLSKEGSKGFAALAKSPTVVVDGAEGVQFAPGITSAEAALKAAGQDIVNMFWASWYKELDTAVRSATNDLMFGRIKADEFCSTIQRKADTIKKDPSVARYRRA